jgi:hypothetical protein
MEETMGLIGNLISATVNTALLPVSVLKDSITVGGALTDEEEPATLSRVRKIIQDLEDGAEDAKEGKIL